MMIATTPSVELDPQHGALGCDERLHEIAALALQFAESLELPAVLDQVARQVATLFGGACQVHFTPAHRPADARCAVADPRPQPSARNGVEGDEPFTALLAWPGAPGQPIADGQSPGPWATTGQEEGGGAALLLAPLIARGRRIGQLAVVLSAPREAPMRCDEGLLGALAPYAALAIDTADQFTRLQPAAGAGSVATPGGDAGPLLAFIAHDLRSPLATLRSSLQLLGRMARGAEELDRSRVVRLADLAEVAVGQLERQISALTPSPATRPPLDEPPSSPIDLVKIARLMANFHQQTTGRHQLTVCAEVPELLGPWSRPHLERLLGNLLINGIKYSPAGGEIRVTVGREEDALGSWATLSVQNHGIGIPTPDLPHITRAGYRASNVGAIPGTGFGLASVHEVVAQCGGTFAIQCEVGGSTSVRIRLPLG
ncbi:MAG: HAMP domain-containing histidine kinase [Chloroflexales bacterium]|nr:HAMP domain-containing histidine kinase [Chloroflexales bacterium]